MSLQQFFAKPRYLLLIGSGTLTIALALSRHLTNDANEFYFGWAAGIAIVTLTVGVVLLVLQHWLNSQ